MQALQVVSVALVLLVAACTGPLRTSPQNAGSGCDAALVSGRLARSSATGFGLRDAEGLVQPVIWPFGFTLRQELTTVVLVDATGRTIAREGDNIEAGGGANAEGIFAICPAESIVVHHGMD